MESHPYLLYYHLWLAVAPNFLHLAIPTLPANNMKESSNPSATTTSFSEVTNKGKKGKYAIKKQSNSDVASALLKMAEQCNEILKDKTRLESDKHSLQLEHTLTEFTKGHHEHLTNERCKLLELNLDTGYGSDASDSQDTKKQISLFKNVYTKLFETLNSISSDP